MLRILLKKYEKENVHFESVLQDLQKKKKKTFQKIYEHPLLFVVLLL